MVFRGRVSSPARGGRRRAAALVECALSLSLLTFLFFVAVDYCRIFYYTVTLENAACAGALYASRDSTHAADATGISAAALADAGNISPAPAVTSALGTDGNGDTTVTVTVSYTFTTVANYPGIPSQVNVAGKVSMRVLP